MVTRRQVQVYADFDGDIDGYSRSSRSGDQEDVDYDTWRLLDELIAAAALVKRGLASPEFEASTRARVAEVAETPAVADMIFDVA